MSVQVFRGRTLAQARRAVEEKLGADAVVVTTRTIKRGGLGGLFAGSEFEVAAVPAAAEKEALALPPKGEVPFAAGAYSGKGPAASSSGGDVSALRAELKGDIRALKAMLARTDGSSLLAEEIAALRELMEGLSPAAARGDKASSRLRAMGLEGPATTALSKALKGRDLTQESLREVLAQSLKATPWPVDSQRATIAVTGPSGVGKTTTAAKLAAHARMTGRTVTLVGCDTFRVGAVEQLARYANLMGADFAVAKNAQELRSTLHTVRTDFVIVDTSGRPPTADGIEMELVTAGGARTAMPRARHVLLCLPASVRAMDAARAAKRYGMLAPPSLAITKFDETDAPAGVVHAFWATKLPVSVACFGPRVPEDIVSATTDRLVDYLVPRAGGKAAAA
jgi:flagellar biosynthesis protein FlhF